MTSRRLGVELFSHVNAFFCSNQLALSIDAGHVSENDRLRLPFVQIGSKIDHESLNPVTKMAWIPNFRLEYSVRKNMSTYSDILLLPTFSDRMTQKILFDLLSNRWRGKMKSTKSSLLQVQNFVGKH